MPVKEVAGSVIEVNEEGFMTNPAQWNKQIAQAIANEEGVGVLSDGHWKVIEFLQKDFKDKGTMPTIRRLKGEGNIPTKDLYDLFPGGPLKKAAKIAGLPKPASCV
jgi:dissimilatory sulfite reductase related protein